MKVYDTFLLGSNPTDLDLLECRLYEHGDTDLVHCYVIVEGDLTFTGQPKPRYYLEHEHRFAKWAHKIRYMPITPSAAFAGKYPGEAWAREHYSRNACKSALVDAEPDDVIIHGDADEILTKDALAFIKGSAIPGTAAPYKMQLRHFSYAVDWEQPWRWLAPSVAYWRDVSDFTVLREAPLRTAPLWPAGWHLSWLGGKQAIETKVRAFSHTEVQGLVLDNMHRFWERGEFVGGGPDGVVHDWYEMAAVDVDSSWPSWVFDGHCPASWYRPRTYR